MSEAILVALITGGLSLTGVVITCLATTDWQIWKGVKSREEAV